MTTLAAWVSVDSRRPSACYLVSDSRITWPDGAQWHTAQKLFVAERSPDIFGFCGDVQFPTLALRQVIEYADRGLLFGAIATAGDRHQAIAAALAAAYKGYPAIKMKTSTVLHFGRDGEGGQSRFRLWRMDWSQSQSHIDRELELPTESVLAESLGSGSHVLIERNKRWKDAQGRTARGIFSSFCEAIASGSDHYSGGAPQLVGLYPKWNGLMFGVVSAGKRFIAGNEVPTAANVHPFEWRNEQFERVDPSTLALLPGAQAQPKPTV